MLHFLYLTFVLLIFHVTSAKAQGAVSVTSDQGLSNSCIRCIYEDSYRNVWITTRNGLNRFDGEAFTVFRHADAQPLSLMNDVVTEVMEYSHGKMLVGTDIGLCMYDYSDNAFRPIPFILNKDTVTRHVVSMSRIDDKSVFVCVVEPGSYIVSQGADGMLHATSTQDYTYQGFSPQYLQRTSDGKVWTSNPGYGVGYFQGKKFCKLKDSRQTAHFCLSSTGKLYIAMESGQVYNYDAMSNSLVDIERGEMPADVVIKNIRKYGDNAVAICTDGNGLFTHNEQTGETLQSTVRTMGYNLATSNIADAIIDSDGNEWIGVYWKGLAVRPNVSTTFEYVGRRSGTKNTLGTNCVTAIHEAEDGWTWVATDHCGLYVLSPDGTSSEHFKPGEVVGVPSTINAVYQDKNRKLWLGSFNGRMVIYNPQTHVFTPCDDTFKDVDKVTHISGDRYDNIWIASVGNGMFRYNLNTCELTQFGALDDTNMSKANRVLGNKWVNVLCINGETMYVGRAGGVDVLTLSAGGNVKYRKSLLHHKIVSDIKVAPDGMIWMGASDGLYCVDASGREGMSIKRLTVADGLSDNVVRSVEINKLDDRYYEVWASTDNGLNCYDVTKRKFHRFFIGDGLQGNEFNDRASLHTGSRMYFGGINGLNYFTPSEVIRNASSKELHFRIVGLYCFGTPIYAGHKSGSHTVYSSWIDDAEELHFAHDDNNISIALATIGGLWQKVIYEYSFDGKEWMSAGEQQSRIVFANMSSGTYDVHIRALANGMVSEERIIRLVIHPAWYATWWAYVIYLLLLVLMTYMIIRYATDRVRTRRILQRHRSERALTEARIQFFMNISHEIRTPMTLILAPLEKLRAMGDDEVHQKNYNLIYQNAHRILRLVNQMLDVQKIEKGQFKLEYTRVELVAFIQNLVDVFAESAKKRNIALDFVHTDDLMDVMVDAPSIDKIVMNLLSNSFKFTPDGGSITLKLSTSPTSLTHFTMSVTDTGVGISDEDKPKVFKRFYSGKHHNGNLGTGIGLNLCMLLTELHGGTIEVMDNPKGQGTRFVIEMPKGKVSATDAPTPSQTDMSEADTALAPNVELSVEKQQGLRHRNILIVEDDSDIRQYLSSELSSDFVVTECHNGQEAWDYAQRNPQKVNIIISDVMMPLMDGYALCHNIKGNYNTSHIPVILLSAKSTDADHIEGMNAGADAYLTKPFNIELLRTTAINILQNRQMLQGKLVSAQKAEAKIDKIEIESPDEQLMERVLRCINGNISNPELSVEFVADKVGVSRVHFHRKIKELTGQTPRDYIKNIRLQQAARLLREKHLDITDVSIATGFKSLSTFSTAFKTVFGMSPTEYMNRKE